MHGCVGSRTEISDSCSCQSKHSTLRQGLLFTIMHAKLERLLLPAGHQQFPFEWTARSYAVSCQVLSRETPLYRDLCILSRQDVPLPSSVLTFAMSVSVKEVCAVEFLLRLVHAAVAPSYTEYRNSTLIAEVIITLTPLVISVSCQTPHATSLSLGFTQTPDHLVPSHWFTVLPESQFFSPCPEE